MKITENKSRGFWARGEKGTMQIILFLVVLGAVVTIQINSGILLMGVAILIGYAYRTAHLSKKEIVLAVVLAATFGLIAIVLPYILVFLAKSKLLVLWLAV